MVPNIRGNKLHGKKIEYRNSIYFCYSTLTSGYTLLELLAVLIVLTALSVIAVPIFHNMLYEAKKEANSQNIQLLKLQAQSYLLKQSIVVASDDIMGDMVSSGFIKEAPKNPLDNSNYIVSVSDNGKINVISGFNGVCNVPRLSEGMIPVIFNGNNFITLSNEEISYTEWYKYNGDIGNGTGEINVDREKNERWANIELQDGSLFVWIPRYTYKIQENGLNSKIWIKYSMGTKDYLEDGFKPHPAFKFGDEQLTGIWVAKFEASENAGKVQVKPAVESWREILVGTAFTKCREMQSEGNTNGLNPDSNIVDSHMIKASEWAAVSYLTEAIRDGIEVSLNGTVYFTGGETTVEKVYKEPANLQQSTTGNAYGIYDMNGGAWEYTASYVNTGNENITLYGESIVNADSKYKNVISLPPPGPDYGRTGNYQITEGLTDGLGLHEISDAEAWTNTFRGYNDIENFPYDNLPFLLFGGDYPMYDNAGIFAYSHWFGDKYVGGSFRPTICVLK